MKLTKAHWIGIIFSVLLLAADLVFFRTDKIFYFLIGIAFVIVALPFIFGIAFEGREEREKSEMFLEFARNLAENVKGGTPIGQSILNMKGKNFGSLTQHIVKLSNQLTIGIPISKALEIFADDIGSVTISRAVTLIKEAENAGGKIDAILDSVAASIYQIEKLKKERKAAISNLVTQGYIIFFIFIGIMLVMQFKIIPLTEGIGVIGTTDTSSNAALAGVLPSNVGIGGGANKAEQYARPFLYLLLIQGIFCGLAIGKLAEGYLKAGVKHSFVLSITAYLVSTGAKLFL